MVACHGRETETKSPLFSPFGYFGLLRKVWASLSTTHFIAMPRLIILARDRSSRQVYISGRMTTIGRNQNNSLVVDRDRVSRKHAMIDWDGARYSIVDIGSRNGTFLNGMRIMQHDLRNGDTITIGDCDLRFLSDVQIAADRSLRLITMPGSLADLQGMPVPA